MRKMLLAAGLMAAGMAIAEDWPKLVEFENGAVLHAKPGSVNIKLGADNQMLVTVDTRFTGPDGKSLTLYELEIAMNDCRQEKGKVMMSSYDGTRSSDAPFLFGSGTGFSIAAEIICSAVDQMLNTAQASEPPAKH